MRRLHGNTAAPVDAAVDPPVDAAVDAAGTVGAKQVAEEADEVDRKIVKCDQCDFVALSVRRYVSH